MSINQMLAKSFPFVQRQRTQKKTSVTLPYVTSGWCGSDGMPSSRYSSPEGLLRTAGIQNRIWQYLSRDPTTLIWTEGMTISCSLSFKSDVKPRGRWLFVLGYSRLRQTIHSTGHSNSLYISTENCNSLWTAVLQRTVSPQRTATLLRTTALQRTGVEKKARVKYLWDWTIL